MWPLLASAQNDSGGTLKVTTRLLPDGSKTVMKTDVEAHTMEATTYNSADKLTQRIIYMLDAQDQPKSGVVYAPNGKPVYKCAYEHDSLGRITEERDYTLANQLIRRFVYEFGNSATAVRIRAFDANGNELQQIGAAVPVTKKDTPKHPPFRHQ